MTARTPSRLRPAAAWALAGVLLQAGWAWRSSLLPVIGVPDVPLATWAILLTSSVLTPAAWSLYFWSVWRGRSRRLAAWIMIVALLWDAGFELTRLAGTISFLSLDSWGLLSTSTIPALCWIVFLLHEADRLGRSMLALWFLLIHALIEIAFAGIGLSQAAQAVAEFGQTDPRAWNLLWFSLILIFYWATRALFLRAAQKA